MREIKFRAWDKKENKYYEPIHEAYKGKLHEILLSLPGHVLIHTMHGLEGGEGIWDRYEIEQSTGLWDKNGKEIYEGDIVTAFGKKEFPEEVKFGEIKDYEYDSFAGMGFYFDFSWVVQKEDIEVIGNIHENPELLKGEDDEHT